MLMPIHRNYYYQTDTPLVKSQTRSAPKSCNIYNYCMNGVDRADANRTRYDYDHRRDKWTRAALYAALKIAIANAWIIKRTLTNNNYTQLAFIEKIPYAYLCSSLSIFFFIESKEVGASE